MIGNVGGPYRPYNVSMGSCSMRIHGSVLTMRQIAGSPAYEEEGISKHCAQEKEHWKEDGHDNYNTRYRKAGLG